MRSKGLLSISLVFLVLGILSVAFLVGCGEEEAATTTTAAPAAPAPTVEFAGDLVIGAVNSMTGPNALTGAEHRWAQERAAADWNAKGGIRLADGKNYRIVLQYADDKSLDTEAASAAERLIKRDGLRILLSSNTTPTNQAAATVAEREQAYYHMTTSWNDVIGGMNLQWGSILFEAAAEAYQAAVGGAKALPEPITKFAVLHENNPDGTVWADGMVAGLEKHGFEIVSREMFAPGQRDFSSAILKFREAGVEGLVTLIAPPDGITFVTQMKENDWVPVYFFGYRGFWPVEFMKALGPDSNYISHNGHWSEKYPHPGAAELGQAFRDAHGGDSSVSIGVSYAGAQTLFMAIERAGVFEPGPVRDEVFGGTFPGTTQGDIVYSEQGVADIKFATLQWMDGDRVLVYPVELAEAPAQPFTPWGQR